MLFTYPNRNIIQVFLCSIMLIGFGCTSNSSSKETTQTSDTLEQKVALTNPTPPTGNKYLDEEIEDVLIGENVFDIQIFRDSLDSNGKVYSDSTESPIYFVFYKDDKLVDLIKESNADQAYVSYEFTKSHGRSLSSPGKLYLKIRTSFGGSGSSINLSSVEEKNSEFWLVSITEYSPALDMIFFHEDDNEFLFVEGQWNQEEGESHYGEHKYLISNYVFNGSSYTKKVFGETKNKYSGLDTDKTNTKIFLEILFKESEIFTGKINILSFIP